MQHRPVTRLVRAAAISGVALALAASTVGLAAAAPAAAPSQKHVFYVATTSASAVALRLTQKPAASIITAQLVDDSLGYTAASFDSSQGSESQAASVFPGNLVVQGPSLLCNEGVLPFPCPVKPPSYPLLADAQYPQHPHATAGPGTPRTGKSSPLAVQAGHASADATANATTGDAVGAAAGLLAGTPVGLSIGAQSSRTTVRVEHGGLTVRIVSHASDIGIGTLLHIGSVTGTVVQRLVPGRRPVDTPSVSVTGVTVAGQSASIGDKGLQIAGRNGPRLLRRLAAQHITVTPVAVTRQDTRRSARSEVTGLVVTATLPVKHTPYVPNPLSSTPPFDQIPGVDVNGTYVATLQLGAAGSAAAVQQQADVGLGGLGTQPVQPVTQPKPPASGAGNPTAGTSGTGAPPASAGTRPAAGSPPRVAAPTDAHGVLDGFTLDLTHLYLVLALGSAVLFAGWRARAMLQHRHWERRA